MRVFISHSRADTSFVKRLKAALLARDIRAWTDDDLSPGVDLTTEIKRAIERSDAVLAVLSTQSEKSQSVASEISLALAERFAGGQKRIIPILADRKAEPPFFLKNFQFVDLSSDERLHKNIDRLYKALERDQLEPPMQVIWGSHQGRIKAEHAMLETEKTELNLRTLERTKWVVSALAMAGFMSLVAVAAAIFTATRDVSHEWVAVLSAVVSFILGAVSTWLWSRLFRRANSKRANSSDNE